MLSKEQTPPPLFSPALPPSPGFIASSQGTPFFRSAVKIGWVDDNLALFVQDESPAQLAENLESDLKAASSQGQAASFEPTQAWVSCLPPVVGGSTGSGISTGSGGGTGSDTGFGGGRAEPDALAWFF